MIQVKDISKFFDTGGYAPRTALEHVSLSFNGSQWCSLLGANGSGKSTLLRILSGELQPSSGAVLFDGVDVTKSSAAKRARNVFFVEQDTKANLVPSMTIEENLLLAECTSFFPGLGPARTAARRKRVSEALGRLNMGLENRLHTQVRFLSGGERQSLVLAEALLSSAPVLLLDEFLAAMDPRMGPRLLSTARQIAHEKGLSVVSVTHNIDHVLMESTPKDRIVMLHEGRVAMDMQVSEMPSKDWLIKQYQGVSAITRTEDNTGGIADAAIA
jgi:putative ABC transport system ATP-binding protein